MAGGTGTRLYPGTKVVNKHLHLIYDKPLIYYSLSTLMLSNISQILLISNEKDLVNFEKLLGDGSQLGINISYSAQNSPNGIAEGLNLGCKFVGTEKVALILGDNLFFGPGLGRKLKKYNDLNGAQIFAYKVSNPDNYGIVELDENEKIVSIEEKPSNPKSSWAITGLYFYDNSVFDIAKNLTKSSRGELEITDINKFYLKANMINVEILPRSTFWLDAGTFEGLYNASTFIRIIQERQKNLIGNPFDIAKAQGWI